MIANWETWPVHIGFSSRDALDCARNSTIAMTPAYGLIGYPLAHSFSPSYFRNKFQQARIAATYQPFLLRHISQLPGIVHAVMNLRGLNVTIPYKSSVIPYLHELSDVADEVGAVNCIDIRKGYLKGYNTDVTGFAQSLTPLLEVHHHHALVLGAGGSSRAVCYVLRKLGVRFRVVSRQDRPGFLQYEHVTPDLLAYHALIINTTPLGMYPHTTLKPLLPYDALTERHLLFDLIYNPLETAFMTEGLRRGASARNGLQMLQSQAEASWDIWTKS